MAAVTMNNVPAGHNTGSGFNAPKNFFKIMIDAIVREFAARKAAHQLSMLSNAQLSDIGINRCEIENAVRNGR